MTGQLPIGSLYDKATIEHPGLAKRGSGTKQGNLYMEDMLTPEQPFPSGALSRDTIVQWSSSPVSATVGQEVVLMSLDRGRCYGLGLTGTALWQKMQEPVRVSELLVQLRQEYDVSSEELERDVLQALQQYAEEGLIAILPARPL